jgi:hypothetical protein
LIIQSLRFILESFTHSKGIIKFSYKEPKTIMDSLEKQKLTAKWAGNGRPCRIDHVMVKSLK